MVLFGRKQFLGDSWPQCFGVKTQALSELVQNGKKNLYLSFGISLDHIVTFPSHCCFGPLSAACEVCLLTPPKIPIEKTSWTLDNLKMPIGSQRKEVEKMLIHHFEAETQGF